MRHRARLLLAAAMAAFSAAFVSWPCQATDRTWQVSSGDWSTPTAWFPPGVPTNSDNLLITGGGTVNVTTSADTCANLTVGGTGSGTVRLVAGGGLTTSASEYIGNSSPGLFTQTGGTHSVAAFIYLSNGSGSSSYSLSGGSLSVFRVFAGYSGSGSFNHSGGTNTANDISVGFTSGINGSYNLSGNGVLSAQTENVGLSGTGSFTQSGGTNSAAQYIILGDGVTGYGTYNLSGGSLYAPIDYVGDFAGGSFTQSGGTNNVTNMLNLGNNSGVSGSYALNGGLLVVGSGGISQGSGSASFSTGGGTLQAGSSFTTSVPIQLTGLGTFDTSGNSLTLSGNLSGATGSLLKLGAGTLAITGSNTYTGGVTIRGGVVQVTSGLLPASNESISSAAIVQSGGTHQVASNFYLGFTFNANASYSLSGGSLQAPYQYVGYNSNGVFTQTGGTNNAAIDCELGYLLTSGTYALSGSGVLTTLNLLVGGQGNGSFIQSGGSVSTNLMYVGSSSGVTGVYNLSGGSIAAVNELVGYSTSGTFTQSAGINVNSTELDVGYSAGGLGIYNLNGGSLVAANDYVGSASGSGSFLQSGGTNTVAGGLVLAKSADTTGTYKLNGGLLVVGSGGITQGTGAAAFQFGSGTLRAAVGFSSSVPMLLTGASVVDTNGNTVAVAGLLSGSGSLVKKGTGLLALTASNTFAGGLVIGGGTVSSVYSLPGAITFTNDPVLQAASAAFSINGNVVIDPNAIAVIDTNGFAVTASGGISGPGDLVKTGPGTLILASPNTFSGETFVSQGTLQVNDAAALQNSSVIVNVDGGLQFNASPVGGGTISLAGLSGSNSVSLTSNGVPIVLSVGGNNSDTTFSGALTDGGTLAKAGTGSLFLSGTSLWTGGLTLDPGIVAINSDFALGAVPPSPTNNIRFVANATFQARNTVNLAANRNISIVPSTTASFDASSGTFTIAGVISGAARWPRSARGRLC